MVHLSIHRGQSIELDQIISVALELGRNVARTGVKNDSATNLARALSFLNSQHVAPFVQQGTKTENEVGKPGVPTKSFISDISLSTSSMNCIMKSTNLCFSISSV